MKIAIFGVHAYDRQFFDAANMTAHHELTYLEPCLDENSARLAQGFVGVCAFVNDRLDEVVLKLLAEGGVRIIALRCAGYNNIDLVAAARLGLSVTRVPAYSPHAVSEFTMGLLLGLERRIPRAWSRVRDDNFSLEGLVGRNLHERTAGIIGTGRIGGLVARALRLGFGCEVLACDPLESPELKAIGVVYVERCELLTRADIISLHCPLTPDTRHLIDEAVIARAQPGVTIVNTSRGALIDAPSVIAGLKSGKIGGLALDVYEQEADLFYEDLSSEVVQDDDFQRLLTFPNVLLTGHQAFLTEEALRAITETTLASFSQSERGEPLSNRIG